MKIRLLVAMKARVEGGGSSILYPGIYDSESETFPEALREESRPGVVQILDAPASEPGLIEPAESEDPDDESNEDLGDSEEQEEGVEEEQVEEEAEKDEPKKGKTKIKRRG